MKLLSYLLMIAGIVVLFFGGYQWYTTTTAQSEATAEAQAMIDERDLSRKTEADEFDAIAAAENYDPNTGETAGILHIPALEADLPIIEGTHEDDLARGVRSEERRVG